MRIFLLVIPMAFHHPKNKALNLGTHEIILRLDILPKVIGLLRSPRFF